MDKGKLNREIIMAAVALSYGHEQPLEDLGQWITLPARREIVEAVEEALVRLGLADLGTTERIRATLNSKESRLPQGLPQARTISELVRIMDDLDRRGIRYRLRDNMFDLPNE